jgi:hypothetical protein
VLGLKKMDGPEGAIKYTVALAVSFVPLVAVKVIVVVP